MTPRRLVSDKEVVFTRVQVTAVFGVILAVFVISLSLYGCQVSKTNKLARSTAALAQANRERVSQAQADRVRARYVLCLEIEKLKAITRVDLRRTLHESERFLRENPEGIPGIPAPLIRKGLRNQRRHLRELAPLPVDPQTVDGYSRIESSCALYARNPASIEVALPPVPAD